MKSQIMCYAAPCDEKPYIFFSYCHEDESEVYCIIERLAAEGFRVWYDNGIIPGQDWLDVVAGHIEECACVIAAISKASVQSNNCSKELNWAVNNSNGRIPIVPMMLDEFNLSTGLKFLIGSTNYIQKHQFSDEEQFYSKLLASPQLCSCRKSSGSDAEKIHVWPGHCKEYRGEYPGPNPEPNPEPKTEPDLIPFKEALSELREHLAAMFDRTVVRGIGAIPVIDETRQLISDANNLLTQIRELLPQLNAKRQEGVQIEKTISSIISDAESFLDTILPDKELQYLGDINAFAEKLKKAYIRHCSAYDAAMNMTEGGPGSTDNEEKINSLKSLAQVVEQTLSNASAESMKASQYEWKKHKEKATQAMSRLEMYLEECRDLLSETESEIKRLEPDKELQLLKEAETVCNMLENACSGYCSAFDDIFDMTEQAGAANKEKAEKLKSIIALIEQTFAEADAQSMKLTLQQWGVHSSEAQQMLARVKTIQTKCKELIRGAKSEVKRLQGSVVLVNLTEGSFRRISEGVRLAGEAGSGVELHTDPNGEYIIKTSGAAVKIEGKESTDSKPVLNGTEFTAFGRNYLFIKGSAAENLTKEHQLLALRAEKTGELHALFNNPVLLDRNHRNLWSGDVLTDRQIHRTAHAKLFLKDGDWMAAHVNIPVDGSEETNPTYVNGIMLRPIASDGETGAVRLNIGDVIRVVCEDFSIVKLELEEEPAK